MTQPPTTAPVPWEGLWFKALATDRRAVYVTGFTWPDPGTWLEVEGPLITCRRGLHVASLPQMPEWLAEELWLVEVDLTGAIHESDKTVVHRARLTEKLPWDERSARLFAADCAERVLPIFERERPGDDRPRRAIEAARAYARGEIRAAAWAAAWAAAGAAAGDAARDAARAAAWAAARDAAGAAAWDAAWDAAGDAAGDAAWAAARAAAGAAAGDAAGDAARVAAGAAAGAAARDAAGDAAGDAARDAARVAAWAAGAAERGWQTERLAHVLGLAG